MLSIFCQVITKKKKTINIHVCVCIYIPEKGMATHSSILAWRIPGTGEPGGLPSMGSHRVRHNWSDLAAAAYINIHIYIYQLLKPMSFHLVVSFLLLYDSAQNSVLSITLAYQYIPHKDTHSHTPHIHIHVSSSMGEALVPSPFPHIVFFYNIFPILNSIL